MYYRRWRCPISRSTLSDIHRAFKMSQERPRKIPIKEWVVDPSMDDLHGTALAALSPGCHAGVVPALPRLARSKRAYV